VDVCDGLTDPRLGILLKSGEVPRIPGAPRFFHYFAESANTGAFCGQENFSLGGGASVDRDMAMAKSFGEAIERYSAAIFDVESFPFCSAREADFPAVAPSDFALYSPEQHAQKDFPFDPFNDDSLVRWVQARKLGQEAPVFVPAGAAYVPFFYYMGTNEAALMQPISTGLACHCSYEEAAIGGICEVIERDCVSISWQARMSAPIIEPRSLDPDNRELLKRFEEVGLSVVMLDMTFDHGVPTVYSVLFGATPDSVAFCVAASAALDPREAARKSLEELEHTRHWCEALKLSPPIEDVEGFANVTDQKGHLRYWIDEGRAQHAAFLTASWERVDFREMPNLSTGCDADDLAVLQERIEGVGEEIYLVDVTSEDIRAHGLHVVRAIVPGFHRLAMGHSIRCLGGERLWTVPQKLGHRGLKRGEADNPFPHPYP
jgi:ribosomal protein S12 methylthiotransferase accessory factor